MLELIFFPDTVPNVTENTSEYLKTPWSLPWATWLKLSSQSFSSDFELNAGSDGFTHRVRISSRPMVGSTPAGTICDALCSQMFVFILFRGFLLYGNGRMRCYLCSFLRVIKLFIRVDKIWE